MSRKYGFPLCLQLTPPEHFIEDRSFCHLLDRLASLSLYGVELNLIDYEQYQPGEVAEFLARFDLRLTLIATGAFAKKTGLYLSCTRETNRIQAVAAVRRIAQFASQVKAGVILGFMKGGMENNPSLEQAQLKKSIRELACVHSSTHLYLEATNHYETTLVNTLAEGAALLETEKENFALLPDTYHMNIDEKNIWAPLIQYRDYYHNIHLSDNNRYYPGFGAIDFYSVLCVLRGMDYKGTMAIEGRNQGTIEEDIEKACDYLALTAKRL